MPITAQDHKERTGEFTQKFEDKIYKLIQDNNAHAEQLARDLKKEFPDLTKRISDPSKEDEELYKFVSSNKHAKAFTPHLNIRTLCIFLFMLLAFLPVVETTPPPPPKPKAPEPKGDDNCYAHTIRTTVAGTSKENVPTLKDGFDPGHFSGKVTLPHKNSAEVVADTVRSDLLYFGIHYNSITTHITQKKSGFSSDELESIVSENPKSHHIVVCKNGLPKKVLDTCNNKGVWCESKTASENPQYVCKLSNGIKSDCRYDGDYHVYVWTPAQSAWSNKFKKSDPKTLKGGLTPAGKHADSGLPELVSYENRCDTVVSVISQAERAHATTAQKSASHSSDILARRNDAVRGIS